MNAAIFGDIFKHKLWLWKLQTKTPYIQIPSIKIQEILLFDILNRFLFFSDRKHTTL